MKKNLLLQTKTSSTRWIITYADFVTMLLALFMVMYALSQMDVMNLREFSKSVGSAFQLPNQKKSINSIPLDKNNLRQIFKTTQAQMSSSKVDVSSDNQSTKQLKEKISQLETKIDKETVEFQNIKTIIEEKLNNTEGISISREPRGLLVRLNNTILFDTGSDIIRGESIELLDKIANILKNINNPIRIEGHTDNIPVKTKRFPSNWELSTARATNIIRYLVEKHDFSPSRLSAIGYGEYMPISDNNSKEGRVNNRRVDIVILSSSSKIFNP